MVGFRQRTQTTCGWVGVELGAHAVKAAQVVRTPLGPRLAAGVVAPCAAGDPFATQGEPAARWRDAVRVTCDLAVGCRGNLAAAAMTVAECELHLLERSTADRGPASDPEPTEAELAPLVAMPLQSLVCASWQAGRLPATSRSRYALCAPRALSNAAVEAFAGSPWRCRALDGLPWAAARALKLTQASDDDASEAMLDWGGSATLLTWGERGIPIHARALKTPGMHALLDDLARKLGLAPRESLQLLRQPDLFAAHRRGCQWVAELAVVRIQELADEVRRTLGYWKMLTRGGAPAAIQLSGGGGLVAAAPTLLTQMLEMPVRVWDLPLAPQAAPIADVPLLAAAAGLSALGWER